MKFNMDINYANRDEDWGHFVSTECNELHNTVVTNYNLHEYNAHNYSVHDYITRNCNVHNRYIKTDISCLPIITSLCIVGSIVVHTTLRLCCGSMF